MLKFAQPKLEKSLKILIGIFGRSSELTFKIWLSFFSFQLMNNDFFPSLSLSDIYMSMQRAWLDFTPLPVRAWSLLLWRLSLETFAVTAKTGPHL